MPKTGRGEYSFEKSNKFLVLFRAGADNFFIIGHAQNFHWACWISMSVFRFRGYPTPPHTHTIKLWSILFAFKGWIKFFLKFPNFYSRVSAKPSLGISLTFPWLSLTFKQKFPWHFFHLWIYIRTSKMCSACCWRLNFCATSKILGWEKKLTVSTRFFNRSKRHFFQKGLLWTLFYQKGAVSRFQNMTSISTPFKTLEELNFCATC